MEQATITIQGKTYNLPPFNTGQIRRSLKPLLEAVVKFGNGPSADPMAQVLAFPDLAGEHADLLLLALRNEYPDLTLEEVESLTFSEVQVALNKVIAMTGLLGER